MAHQLLSNLISNAIKYAPSPRRTKRSSDYPTRRSIGAGQRHRVPLTLDNLIFDRFFRDPESAGSHHGTGLGLAICRGIVGTSRRNHRPCHQGGRFIGNPASSSTYQLRRDAKLVAHDQRCTSIPPIRLGRHPKPKVHCYELLSLDVS